MIGGQKGRKLGLSDIILTNICVIFTIEACASAASLGYTAVFWWLLLFVTYLLPYGLIVSELGTTYAGGSGVYEWVKRAFGERWATREAWWYWVNYFTWLASVAVLLPVVINGLLPHDMPWGLTLAIELAFIWLVVYVSSHKVDQTNWLMRSGALANIFLAICVVVAAVWHGTTYGLATPFDPSDLLPDLTRLESWNGLDIIIYNYMGAEVIATFIGYMRNPRRDIPRAVVAAGLVMLVIYLLISVGISIAIPAGEIEADSGLLDALALMLGRQSPVYAVVSLCFMWSCFTNMMSWATGVAQVVHQAGRSGSLPAVFGIESGRRQLYVGATVTTGVVTSLVVLAEPLLQTLGLGIFEVVFSIDIVYTLLAYVPMFPAFLKLRRIDPDRPRPYKVSGGPVFLHVMAWIAVLELVGAIAMITIPMNGSPVELAKLPLLAIAVGVFLLGELIGAVVHARRREVAGAAK